MSHDAYLSGSDFGLELLWATILGSEQAFASVRLPDTFAEGAWDKLPKTRGIPILTHSPNWDNDTLGYKTTYQGIMRHIG